MKVNHLCTSVQGPIILLVTLMALRYALINKGASILYGRNFIGTIIHTKALKLNQIKISWNALILLGLVL